MEEGATLVIAEKPSSARSIATALASISGERPRSKNFRGVKFYEVNVQGRLHIVAPALGHLYGIAQRGSGWTYPVFDIEWRPAWQIDKSSSHTKPYLENFLNLAKICSSFISATDYDREGSVIAYNILRMACGTEEARRMKFSTLTIPDLVKSYKSAQNQLDHGQIKAGLTRHILDWYWGVNISRALTLAMKPHTGGFDILSSGRVQGPTLKILTEREREIERFVPKKFWTVELSCRHEGVEFAAVSDPARIWDEQEADRILSDCAGRNAKVAECKTATSELPPPPAFDLTTLQTEAYRHLGFTPMRTMTLAQRLYEAALISYPRTSSQKLPPTIGYRRILSELSQQGQYAQICEYLLSRKPRPRQGRKSDPAHPAIYPTGKVPSGLPSDQLKLYDLITRRFLSAFGEPAKRESTEARLEISGHPFICRGHRTVEANWLLIYGPYSKLEEAALPHLAVGEEVEVVGIDKLEKETQPPKRYTPASIIREMEKRSLGTKGTRASILQTLFDRGYVRGRSIEVTELGVSVVETLAKYCPDLLSEELTAKFESALEKIEHGVLSMETVIEDAKATLTQILIQFKEKEEAIGRELAEASRKMKNSEREIGTCPRCGGTLRIVRSRSSGKRFIGCTGYKDGCTFSAPLPQRGRITVTKRTCKGCGLPLLSVSQKGRRPWVFCFNVECPLKKDVRGESNEEDQPRKASGDTH